MEIDDARKEIEHLLESRAFGSSETHRRLLEYLAAKTLSGETDHLKEYTVGIEAFGKPLGYDPQEDSIVRTQTSRLRLKLLEYYKFEGKDDAVLVEIPRGGFKLEFHRRNAVPPTVEINGTQNSAVAMPAGKRGPSARLPWILCGVLALACVVLGYTTWSSRDEAAADVPWPLSRVVNARQQTIIVLPDSILAMLRFINGRHTSLEEYLSSDYPKLLMPEDMTPRGPGFSGW